MTSMLLGCGFAVAMAAAVCLFSPAAGAADFASSKPEARVECWQRRLAAISAQIADAASLRAIKLVFVGDPVTDFWLLDDDA